MSRTRMHSVNVCRCAVVIFSVSFAASGGDLNPPAGPVAPTMKTLDEVEPRIPIRAADLPLTISAPGSYYLVEDVNAPAAGITIASDGVSIDLMGFSLRGGTNEAIRATGGTRHHIVVRNGRVQGWNGIGINLVTAQESVFEDLLISGCTIDGLRAGSACIIRRVVVESNLQQGMTTGGSCTISDCIARLNGTRGMAIGTNSVATGCTAVSNGGGGIRVSGGASIFRSSAASNGAGGFEMQTILGTGATIEDCTARGNTGAGFMVHQKSTIRGCTSIENTGAGILADDIENTILDNVVRNNAIGLDINGTGCRISNNTVERNTDNYDIVAGNELNILLCEIPESIDWPANVLLAGSLMGTVGSDGITVLANDVTIDLGGHALVGVPGSLAAIFAMDGLTIRNGAIRGWEFGAGVGVGALIEDVVAIGNENGFQVGRSSIVRGCRLESNLNRGILASEGCLIESTTVRGNGGAGITFTGDRGAVIDCVVASNGGTGIDALNETKISGCTVSGMLGGGGAVTCIRVLRACMVRDNLVTLGPTDTGIEAANVGASILDNVVTADNAASGPGILISGTANIVGRNSVNLFFLTTTFSTNAGNSIGPIINVSGVGDISLVPGSDHPMANLLH